MAPRNLRSYSLYLLPDWLLTSDGHRKSFKISTKEFCQCLKWNLTRLNPLARIVDLEIRFSAKKYYIYMTKSWSSHAYFKSYDRKRVFVHNFWTQIVIFDENFQIFSKIVHSLALFTQSCQEFMIGIRNCSSVHQSFIIRLIMRRCFIIFHVLLVLIGRAWGNRQIMSVRLRFYD